MQFLSAEDHPDSSRGQKKAEADKKKVHLLKLLVKHELRDTIDGVSNNFVLMHLHSFCTNALTSFDTDALAPIWY